MAESSRTRPLATEHFKDAGLDALASTANVAQFVSFAPGVEPRVRFVRLRGSDSRNGSLTLEAAVAKLLAQSGEGLVNVRSFDPLQPKSNEFIYGIGDVATAVAAVRRLASAGFYTIVNETIDVTDGGVSGVVYGDVVEFAPDDTPRCVEKPGVASLPRALGLKLLETVYGFRPALEYDRATRIEFSIHPLRRGVRHDHTIVWEQEGAEDVTLGPELIWPNRFSRLIGDKAYGLLFADAVGLRVPRTHVVARRVAPFSFGTSTGTSEWWIRTAPVEPVPGRFTTRRGWCDPYVLLQREDPEGVQIASTLAQEGVRAAYSGAAAASSSGEASDVIIEGVAGTGDEFMQAARSPERLPDAVINDVHDAYRVVATRIGPARFEWVHDGDSLWIVQLHHGGTPSTGLTIFPGVPEREHRFAIERGLEALRALVAELDAGDGVVLVGAVGVTSHAGDILRRARVPSRIERAGSPTPLRLFGRA